MIKNIITPFKGSDGKYHYLYKIRNILNDKIYIGIHSTDDLSDGYMGSGKILKCAFKKYGLNNFEKTHINFFQTREEAGKAEEDVVNYDFVFRDDTYNVRLGGDRPLPNCITKEKMRIMRNKRETKADIRKLLLKLTFSRKQKLPKLKPRKTNKGNYNWMIQYSKNGKRKTWFFNDLVEAELFAEKYKENIILEELINKDDEELLKVLNHPKQYYHITFWDSMKEPSKPAQE